MSENVVIKKDRTVTVPASEAKIGVQYDHNVNVITFDCPRYPDDDRNVDMSTMQIYINYMLPDKTLGSYLAENVKVDTNNPDTIHFDWKITRNVTQVKGALQALVCIKKVDAEGNELYHWNTDLIQSFRVGEGMECLETISSDYADVISQLLVNMNTVTGEFEALFADVTARTSEETLQGLVNNAASDEKLRSIVNAYMEANPVGINVDDTLAVSGDAADAKITGDRISELKSDLGNIIEQTGTEERVITIVPEKHEGYMTNDGAINSASTLYYTQKIEVKEGDKLVPHSNTVNPTFRFVTAFNGNNAVVSSGADITSSYTVPAGIDGVVVTLRYDHNITNITQERTVIVYGVKGLSNKADKNQGEANYGKVWTVGEDGSLVLKSVDSLKTKHIQKLSKSVDTLNSGDTLTLKEKDITFKNKTMTFYANVSEMGTIRIGHGYKAYGGVYFDIDSTNVKRYYSYGGDTDSPTDTLEHNLTISDFISVVIISTDVDISISIISKSGMFSHTFSNKDSGRNGSIFVTSLGGTYTNCVGNWHCDDYNKNIFAMGDSYFSLSNPKRWTKYINDLGFDNWLMLGYPGMGVIDAYNGFVDALNYSTPIFALWCMGMNNPDTDTAISSTWKTYTENFLSVCKEKEITPILCTIPNVIGGTVGDTSISTMRNHSFKNQYVISSGYRYIDFANAVGADADGNWYPNMLSDDGVHPDELGAKALFSRAIVDMPELLSKTI